MTKMKSALMALVIAVGAAITVRSLPYRPKHKAGECFILHPMKDGQAGVPLALEIHKVTEDGKYEGVMWIGFVIPRDILVDAKTADKDMASWNEEQVDCNTGAAVNAPSGAPTPSPSPGPSPEADGE